MDTVDLLIHVHPELSPAVRAKLEREVAACNGVISAHFDHHKHPHALIVLYNPEAIQSVKMLEIAQRYDVTATMAGL